MDAQNHSFYSFHPRSSDGGATEPFPQDSFTMSEYSSLWPLWSALTPDQRKTEWRKRRERCMVWLSSEIDRSNRKIAFDKERRAIRSVEMNRNRMQKKLLTDEEKKKIANDKDEYNNQIDKDTPKKRKRNETQENEHQRKKRKNEIPEESVEDFDDDLSENGNMEDVSEDYKLNRFKDEKELDHFGNKRNKLSLKQKYEMVKHKSENEVDKETLAIHAAVMKAEGKRDKLNAKVLKNQMKQMKHKKKKTKENWEKRVKDEDTEMKNRKHIKDLNRQLKKVRGRPGFEGGRHILNSLANIKKIVKNKKGKK